MRDKFHAFIPFDLEKASDGKSYRIKGVASTPDEDSDGESLDPHGFDYTPFLRTGFLNWNHRSKEEPGAIVGEPTKAFVKDNQFYIEGVLYPNSKKAQEIIELSEILEASGSSRKLGFSIEGKALMRDPINKKKVLKAKITGCAITPVPKNPGTIMEVMKGEDNAFEELDYDIQKGKGPNGGEIEYIIDVTDSEGVRRIVDKDFNIKIYKMDTGDMEPVTAESVEGVKRKGKMHYQGETENLEKNERILTKGELYARIFSMFNVDIEKADRIYSLYKKFGTMINKNSLNISDEALQKAEAILLAAEEQEKIEKGEADAKETEASQLDLLKSQAEELGFTLVKSETEEEEEEEGEEEEGEEEEGEDGKGKAAKIEKSKTSDVDFSNIIEKAVTSALEKANASNVELVDKINELQGKVDQIEQAPVQRKGMTSFTERFEKSYPDHSIYSMARKDHRGELTQKLFHLSNIEKGQDVDQDLVKAIQNLEATGNLIDPSFPEEGKRLLTKLEAKHKIVVTQ